MSKKKRRKDGLHLTDKKHPKQGIWSTVLGILSLVLFLVLCFLSGEAVEKPEFGSVFGEWFALPLISGALC